MSGTSNVSGRVPDDLRVMAPLFEVGHVWVVITVRDWVPVNLIVVHLVSYQGWDSEWFSASANILAKASATG